MAKQIKEAKEDNYGALNSQFDELFAMTDKAREYEDDLIGAIFDAKDGDDDAEIFLLNKCKKMIFYTFWTNFIGKEASKKVIRMRLANGEFGDFLSLVYIAFEKAIKAFNPDEYQDMKIGNFQYYLGRYLKAEAISYNNKEDEDPTKGAINPDGMTSETESKGAGTGNAWDSMIGGAEDEHDADFFEDWKGFCRDPRMNEPLSKKVSTPRKTVIAKVLKGDKTVPQIADELGVTKATLYSALDIGDILKDHGISQSEMARYLKIDPDKIIKPLQESKSFRESKHALYDSKGLIYDIAMDLQNLDGGEDFLDMYSHIFNRGDASYKELDDLASALFEYGFEDQAEKIWDDIAPERQGL
jgi:hypothetical protein